MSYEEESRALLNWVMDQEKQIEQKYSPKLPGHDDRAAGDRRALTKQFNQKLFELRKKYGKR